jgi:hypothetical protein
MSGTERVTGVTSHIVANCQFASEKKAKLDQSLRCGRSWTASEPFWPLHALKTASPINGRQ